MFGLVRKKTSYEAHAAQLYIVCMEQAFQPKFFAEFGVKDSFDGRFEVLVVHVFMVLQRLNQEPGNEELAQAVFDVTFANMDQSLRSAGVGDMGVPKRIKKMMIAFNGRMHAYQAALDDANDVSGALKDALRRNVYGAMDAVDEKALNGFTGYIEENVALLSTQRMDDLCAGMVQFTDIKT